MPPCSRLLFSAQGNASQRKLQQEHEFQRVAVSGPGVRQRILQPNEQFVLDKNTGKQEIKTVDVSYIVAWKDAGFRFRDVRLEDIMHAIERWYDVTVFYENQEERIIASDLM